MTRFTWFLAVSCAAHGALLASAVQAGPSFQVQTAPICVELAFEVPAAAVPAESAEVPPPCPHPDEPALAPPVPEERSDPPPSCPSEASRPGASSAPVPRGDNKPPAYPLLARRRGWEGRVVVRAEVGPDGRPVSVVVVESSGYAVLDRAAEEAVAGWRFRQNEGTRNKDMSPFCLVPLRFELKAP